MCVYAITAEQVVVRHWGPGAPSESVVLVAGTVSLPLHRLNQVNLSRREQETGTEQNRTGQDRTGQDKTRH